MNPQCAKCKKTVYPMEKLNCLDKYWHKGCFKCDVCGMTLNMRNYKGYNKLPYCSAHYPTTKHTVIADTVENRRLKENTKQQSQLQYHKRYEEERGHYTVISDDPETLRAMKASKNASDLAYHSGQQAGATDPRMPSYALRPAKTPEAKPKADRYIATYDYTSADTDEINLQEGDYITDPTKIDDGWMEGRNQRTGKFGMFPANYVKRA